MITNDHRDRRRRFVTRINNAHCYCHLSRKGIESECQDNLQHEALSNTNQHKKYLGKACKSQIWSEQGSITEIRGGHFF